MIKTSKHPKKIFVAMISSLGLCVSCAKSSGSSSSTSGSSASNNQSSGSSSSSSSASGSTSTPSSTKPSTPPVVTPTTPVAADPTAAPAAYYPLAWEKTKVGSSAWSEFLINDIKTNSKNLLAGTDDVEDFCPNYYQLNVDQKANFWGMLFSGVAKYESAWNPLDRFNETTMGTDPITHQPVYSEGLLQMSYQDIQFMPTCGFDWSKDKNLAVQDPKKTILQPNINLDCGMKVMDHQVALRHRITVGRGQAYWSTLQTGGTYNVISSIEKITKTLPFCAVSSN